MISHPSTEDVTPSASVAPGTAPSLDETFRPWLTLGVMALCVAIFVGIHLTGEAPSWELLGRWGAPSGPDIWNGAYWGLFTSVFVHVEVWHLAFNLYWLWIFGRTLERSIGRRRWLVLFTAAAVVSSAAQLGFSEATGIGLSGVMYAFFGYLWIARDSDPTFRKIVTSQTVLLFLVWLVGCIVASAAGIARIGNAAHVAGLAFGAAVAWASVRAPRSHLARAAVAAVAAASLVGIVWCPWNFSWVASKAYRAHRRGDYPAAVAWYLKARRFDRQPAWVLRNLAYAYQSLGDQSHYAAVMKELESMHPNEDDEREDVDSRRAARPTPRAARSGS
jgi:GlpG protein